MKYSTVIVILARPLPGCSLGGRELARAISSTCLIWQSGATRKRRRLHGRDFPASIGPLPEDLINFLGRIGVLLHAVEISNSSAQRCTGCNCFICLNHRATNSQHKCKEICEGLGLDKSVPLTPIAEDTPETAKNKKRLKSPTRRRKMGLGGLRAPV